MAEYMAPWEEHCLWVQPYSRNKFNNETHNKILCFSTPSVLVKARVTINNTIIVRYRIQTVKLFEKNTFSTEKYENNTIFRV